MKRVMLLAVVLGLAVLVPGVGVAQPTYRLQVANQSVVSGEFFFEIYMLRTGGTEFYLGNADFVLTFTSANFTSPVVSLVSTDAQLGTWYTVDPMLVGDRVIVNVAPPGVTTTPQLTQRGLNVSNSGLGSLIARVKITGVSNPNGTAGLAWRDVLPNATSVSYIDPATFNLTGMTNPTFHTPPPSAPLPVTLTSFAGNASASAGGVVLEWKTASEVNNYGYTVQRKGVEGDFADLSGSFIAGKGTTLEPQEYKFVDRSVSAAGTYTYRLKQQDMGGGVFYSQAVIVNVTVTDVAEVAPKVFQLMQNYPNPFNPTTQLKFSVETTGRAVMTVYNMLGAEVATLFDGTAEAGRYYVATFDAKGLATGIYLYRLIADQKTAVHKMLLVK